MTESSDAGDIEAVLIREIATILGKEKGSITPQTPLKSLGMDSIRFVEIIIIVEKRFGIKLMEIGLDRDALENIASLSRCIAAAKKPR
jgi:acyl carrier protein